MIVCFSDALTDTVVDILKVTHCHNDFMLMLYFFCHVHSTCIC